MSVTIGLDIGGSKVLGVVLDDAGTVLREARRASPHVGFDALITTSAAIVATLACDAAPVGVGIAGLVDREGHMSYGPNLPLVRDAPVRTALEEATGHRVIVDNDAGLAGLGEITYGAAAGARHVLFVTLGTGIGGALLLDGRLYRGAHNFGAEIGHFTVDRNGPRCACGELGHWEAIASGTALGRLAREVVSQGGGAAIVAAAGGDASAVTGMHVGEAARHGDPDAHHVLVEYADNVALGLAGLANVLDPEAIIVAGGVVELGPPLFAPLRDAFARHVEGVDYRPPIPILPAVMGERAGAVGAAVLARSLL